MTVSKLETAEELRSANAQPDSERYCSVISPSVPSEAQAADSQISNLQLDGLDEKPVQETTVTEDTPDTPKKQNDARSPLPDAHQFPHTQIVYADSDFASPPPLNYSLRTRKTPIFWFWTLIVLDCVCMPIGLYFGMWYGTTRDQLSANAVFSISTALLGTVSIVEYFVRFRRLWRKGSKCRVIGAHRWYLDWFHWNLSVGWFFVMIELIV